MSSPTVIESTEQFSQLLSSSRIVIAKFHADWDGPSKAVAGLYQQLSAELSKPNVVTFTKINTEKQQQITQAYAITSIPTFIMFREGKVAEKVHGSNPMKLESLVHKIAQEAEKGAKTSAGPSSSSSAVFNSALGWRGAALPRGYTDVTDQVELPRTELLNYDDELGSVRALVDTTKPRALSGGKQTEKDWVVSDTDPQLLLFTPFMSMLKLHTLQITSVVDEDEDIMRPKVIKLFTNRPHNLGFDDAEGEAPTQTIELSEKDWNSESTANISLRFVKFQNINSLVIFIESGDGEGEKTRIDRVRMIGDTGEKRDQGKLEKIGGEES